MDPSEWLSFLRAYVYALLNAAFAVIGSAMALNEIAGALFGRSWKWPREHRRATFVALVLVSQAWAYRSKESEGKDALGAMRNERDAAVARTENPQHANLAGDLNTARQEKDNLSGQLTAMANALTAAQQHITDLQQQLGRVKQAPTVVMQPGESQKPFIGWGVTSPVERDETTRETRVNFGLRNFTGNVVRVTLKAWIEVNGTPAATFERQMTFGTQQEFRVSLRRPLTAAEEADVWDKRVSQAVVVVMLSITEPAGIKPYRLSARIVPERMQLDVLE
jgi:hypothetical protein